MLGRLTLVALLVLAAEKGCGNGRTGGDGGGRGPQFNQASTESMCNVMSFATITVNNPHQSKGTPTDMTGKVQVHCTKSLEALNIEVKIQRRASNGEWVDHTSVFTVPYVPAPERAKPYVGQAVAPCPKQYPNVKFRTMGRAEGTFEGRPAGMTKWKASGQVTVQCK